MKNYSLYNANAYKMLEEFKRNNIKVDHIITDPPYNISKDNNFNTLKNPRAGVHFGEWDNGKFDLYTWIKDYSELIDTDGSFIIFCSYRYMSYVIDAMESVDILVKDVIVWQKTNPMPRNIDRRYVQDMEFAVWGVKKGAKWIFNKPSSKPYLRSLFKTSTVSGKERYNHPTQKSLNLMKNLIRIHSNKDDLILDPFMGTGTTGDAALSLKRRFIGVELDKDYYEISKNRLKEKYGE